MSVKYPTNGSVLSELNLNQEVTINMQNDYAYFYTDFKRLAPGDKFYFEIQDASDNLTYELWSSDNKLLLKSKDPIKFENTFLVDIFVRVIVKDETDSLISQGNIVAKVSDNSFIGGGEFYRPDITQIPETMMYNNPNKDLYGSFPSRVYLHDNGFLTQVYHKIWDRNFLLFFDYEGSLKKVMDIVSYNLNRKLFQEGDIFYFSNVNKFNNMIPDDITEVEIYKVDVKNGSISVMKTTPSNYSSSDQISCFFTKNHYGCSLIEVPASEGNPPQKIITITKEKWDWEVFAEPDYKINLDYRGNLLDIISCNIYINEEGELEDAEFIIQGWNNEGNYPELLIFNKEGKYKSYIDNVYTIFPSEDVFIVGENDNNGSTNIYYATYNRKDGYFIFETLSTLDSGRYPIVFSDIKNLENTVFVQRTNLDDYTIQVKFDDSIPIYEDNGSIVYIPLSIDITNTIFSYFRNKNKEIVILLGNSFIYGEGGLLLFKVKPDGTYDSSLISIFGSGSGSGVGLGSGKGIIGSGSGNGGPVPINGSGSGSGVGLGSGKGIIGSGSGNGGPVPINGSGSGNGGGL